MFKTEDNTTNTLSPYTAESDHVTGGASSNLPDSNAASAQGEAARGRNRRQLSGSRAGRRVGLEHLRHRVYSPSDLSGYSLRDRLVIYAADIFFYVLMHLICLTVRWEVQGIEHLETIYKNGHRAIFTSWHSCIFTATWFWRRRGIVVMSSYSRDAEYIGRLIKRFGYGTVRGSATRGGGRALAEMAGCLESGIDVGFTIDGPRGPAHVAKAGAVTLARHTSQAIFPFHITALRYLALPSWDRLQIPLPFTRAVVLIAEPIYVPRDASGQEVESKQAALQATLDGLRREGEIWRSR